MSLLRGLVILAALTVPAGVVSAAPVNGTGLVTPDVIFGSGNANGSFTGVNVRRDRAGAAGEAAL
ncbi:MAG: hypothetical protein KatS3mg118_0720 [Paracoccaceae bacterium]|nr:MAG: hypothetical protein KatS3mg118_0720 [Paracoccaceae bacterium]